MWFTYRPTLKKGGNGEAPNRGRSLPEALRKADGALILEACSSKGFKPAFPEISFNLITGATKKPQKWRAH
ncbi:MAG: hypothetical protein L6U16_12105 [Porphyromonadaceae bacterium]|nr:MAG: hypothetical protein L6U16_12105 [Porphyromonadaceae bacterium]